MRAHRDSIACALTHMAHVFSPKARAVRLDSRLERRALCMYLFLSLSPQRGAGSLLLGGRIFALDSCFSYPQAAREGYPTKIA